jgi:2-C-methyl-D-erythritol 4-phosphate cytidylyltransferase
MTTAAILVAAGSSAGMGFDNKFFAMETPQAARHDLLLAALEAHHPGATDEVSALIANGIHPVPGLHEGLNFKITFPRDHMRAEFFLQES